MDVGEDLQTGAAFQMGRKMLPIILLVSKDKSVLKRGWHLKNYKHSAGVVV